MVERREFQRLKLAKPILGMMDGRSALILDIGIGGAFVEHRGRANEGMRFRLTFKFQGADITFEAEVVRSSVIREGGDDGIVSHSAVQFTKAHGDSDAMLEKMMGTFVGQLLAAHRANASAESGAAILSQLGQARRDRSRGLKRYRWNGKAWGHSATDDRKQPQDGFTVAAYEDEEELATLCQAYEAADEEGRRLIRLIAELSVRSATK